MDVLIKLNKILSVNGTALSNSNTTATGTYPSTPNRSENIKTQNPERETLIMSPMHNRKNREAYVLFANCGHLVPTDPTAVNLSPVTRNLGIILSNDHGVCPWCATPEEILWNLQESPQSVQRKSTTLQDWAQSMPRRRRVRQKETGTAMTSIVSKLKGL